MIYSGSEESGPVTTGTSTMIETPPFNEIYNDNAYVGYMYTVGEIHGLGTDSTIKGVLDAWYNSNLTSYKNYITSGGGAAFCNDRTPTSGSGLKTTYTEYAGYNRLINNKTPSFKCINIGDIFDTRIGLITSDEVAYAGGVAFTNNQNYYLYTGQYYWTMTPFRYYSAYSYEFIVATSGGLDFHHVDGSMGVRPVINLRSDVTLTGTGTSTDPYVVS